MTDWLSLIEFSISPAEIVVRGSVMYLVLLLMFRFILRRDIGNMGLGDFLFVALVADASQNAMSGDTHTLADGLLLVATLAFWNFLFDYLSFRSPRIRRLIEPRAVLLVKDGRLQLHNMRREYISRSEVLAKMREQGFAHLSQIREMRLESDGAISVVSTD